MDMNNSRRKRMKALNYISSRSCIIVYMTRMKMATITRKMSEKVVLAHLIWMSEIYIFSVHQFMTISCNHVFSPYPIGRRRLHSINQKRWSVICRFSNDQK